jgi:hypothetical protein
MANPSDLVTASGTDVALILAEQRLAVLRHAESPDEGEVLTLYKIIANTPPASLLGARVKLRLILDTELGLSAIETSADDLVSLRQVVELIEELV